MKAVSTCSKRRITARLAWSAIFLLRALFATAILVLAVVVTGVCYLIALPFLFIQSKYTQRRCYGRNFNQ